MHICYNQIVCYSTFKASLTAPFVRNFVYELFWNCLAYFLSFLIGKKSIYNLRHKVPPSMYSAPLLGVMVGGAFSQSFLIAFSVTGVFNQIS